jgi:hypothetical protein
MGVILLVLLTGWSASDARFVHIVDKCDVGADEVDSLLDVRANWPTEVAFHVHADAMALAHRSKYKRLTVTAARVSLQNLVDARLTVVQDEADNDASAHASLRRHQPPPQLPAHQQPKQQPNAAHARKDGIMQQTATSAAYHTKLFFMCVFGNLLIFSPFLVFYLWTISREVIVEGREGGEGVGGEGGQELGSFQHPDLRGFAHGRDSL